MTKKCQCGCGVELTGKQRKWASDACRKRQNRRSEKSVRFHAKMSGLRPLSPGKIVKMRLIIKCDGLYPHLYDSQNKLLLAIQHVTSGQKVAESVENALNEAIPGYKFYVIVLPGP